MVDGVTPHMDSSKPGGRKPSLSPRYVKQELEFRPAGKGNSSRGTQQQDKPHSQPSFGKNSYQDNGQTVPSNDTANGSKLGQKAPKAIDGLSDPGSFAEQAGQPKLPSGPTRNGKSSETEQGNNAPVQEPQAEDGKSSDATDSQRGPESDAIPSPQSTSETQKGSDESTPDEPDSDANDEAKKQQRANDLARNQDKATPSKIIKDPTHKTANKGISLLFGNGTLGNFVKKLWANPIIKRLILTLGPPCCCALGLALVIGLAVYFLLFDPSTSFLTKTLFLQGIKN